MLKAKIFLGEKIDTELKIILQLFRQYMTDLFINLQNEKQMQGCSATGYVD